LSTSNSYVANILRETFINELKEIQNLYPPPFVKEKYENYLMWLKLNNA